MNRRIVLAGIAAAVVFVAVLVGLLAYGSAAGGRKTFSTTKLIPAGADFYMALNTDASSSQWISFANLLESVNVAEPLRKAWFEALTEQDIDWDTDIVANLGGEAAFAITDFADVEEEQGVVGVVELHDSDQAVTALRDLIESSAEQDGETILEDKYGDDTLLYSQNAAGQDDAAYAFVDDVLVFAVNRDDLKNAIDVVRGDAPSLADDDRFQAVKSHQSGDFLLWGYADLASAWNLFDDLAASTGQVDSSTLDLLSQAEASADALSFSVGAYEYGLVSDTLVLRAPDEPPPENRYVYDADFESRLPEDTVFFVGSASDQAAIGDYIDQMRSESPDFDQVMSQFADEVGFDLGDGLLAHLGGRSGFAANFSLNGDAPEFSLISLLGVDNAALIQQNLETLGAYASDQGLTVTPPDSAGVSHILLDDQGFDAVGWGIVDDTLVVGYPDTEVTAYKQGPTRSLADAPDWQRLRELLPANPSYVMYVSLQRILAEADAAADLDSEIRSATDGDITLADLAPIRAIGLAGTTNDVGTTLRVVLLIEE